MSIVLELEDACSLRFFVRDQLTSEPHYTKVRIANPSYDLLLHSRLLAMVFNLQLRYHVALLLLVCAPTSLSLGYLKRASTPLNFLATVPVLSNKEETRIQRYGLRNALQSSLFFGGIIFGLWQFYLCAIIIISNDHVSRIIIIM